MDRSFLKHAAVYGVATILVQAGSFVLLPIYLRCLSPDDYGVLEVLGRAAETLAAVLLLGGFRQALFTFYQQGKDETERRSIVSGAFLLVLIAQLVGAVGFWWAGDRVSELLGLQGVSSRLLVLAVAGILLEPLTLYPLSLLQARTESSTYVLVVVSQFLARVGLCIFFVRFLHWGVAGALLASALVSASVGILLSVRELSCGLAWPDFHRLWAMISFALPLLPGGLCFFVLHHGDRFFLMRYTTQAETGTYALGYKLAMVVPLLSLGPLFMVWSSRMYAVASQPHASLVFGRTFTRIMAACLFTGLGVSLFAPEVVHLLGGELYAPAIPVVAPVVFACIMQSAATLMDAGFYIKRRMGLKLCVSIASTLVMLLLYGVLIPSQGAIGAALATLGGFTFLVGATYCVTQQIFPVTYEWSRLVALFAITMGCWTVCPCLPTGGWGIAAKVGVLFLAPFTVLLSGLVHSDELRFLRDLGRRSIVWFRRVDRHPEGTVA